MLESIRDKLFPSSPAETSIRLLEDPGTCNLNGGAAILESYQNDWNLLHISNEQNAKKSEEVDKRISVLKESCDKHWDKVGLLLVHLGSLPATLDDMRNMNKKFEILENSFQDLEKSMLALENIIEIQEIQEKQLDDRFNLTLYTEKKRADFDTVRDRLAIQHENKVIRHEAEKKVVLHERQEVFQEAFDGDMEYYKKHGKIEKVNSTRSGDEDLKLEDVELDQLSDDLDTFLGAEASEDCVDADLSTDGGTAPGVPKADDQDDCSVQVSVITDDVTREDVIDTTTTTTSNEDETTVNVTVTSLQGQFPILQQIN